MEMQPELCRVEYALGVLRPLSGCDCHTPCILEKYLGPRYGEAYSSDCPPF